MKLFRWLFYWLHYATIQIHIDLDFHDRVLWGAFWSAVVGFLVAVFRVITGQEDWSVLFTYPMLGLLWGSVGVGLCFGYFPVFLLVCLVLFRR